MEKLQEAIEKARAKRQAVTSSGARAKRGEAAGTSVSDAWAALTPYQPNERKLIRNRIVTYNASHQANAFDIMRTKAILQMRKNNWRRLAITAPHAACGKTTLSCNIALGLSRQPDIRAHLFEFDLRRPNMARMLGHRPENDIRSVLTGATDFADQAIRVRENVAISMARQPTSDPTRYMLSQKTEDCLSELEKRYETDVMIFDMPPLLVSDDARAFLSKVDCVMLVARAEKTTVHEIDVCEREIADQSNMLGVVLNQCRFADGSAGYGYEPY